MTHDDPREPVLFTHYIPCYAAYAADAARTRTLKQCAEIVRAAYPDGVTCVLNLSFPLSVSQETSR